MSIMYERDAALRQGIAGAGSILGSALQARMQQQRAEEERTKQQKQMMEYGTILQETLGQLPSGASSIDMVRAYSQAIERGLPVEMAEKMSSLQKALSGPSGIGLEKKDEFVEALTGIGMPEEQAEREASLYLAFPTGARTEYGKMIIDRLQRGQITDQFPFTEITEDMVERRVEPSKEGPRVVREPVKEYKFPNVSKEVFQDRTPKERAQFKGELLKSNAAKYQEAYEGVQAAEDELFRFNQMNELNQTGRLPEGLQAFANVNWATGEVRIPRLSTPEAQAYVKLVNDFTTKAKDSYGARVTNFELQRFLKRLPTLANSKEGRQLILDQLKMATDINKLEAEAITKVYDHYGSQNVTPDVALREARKLVKPQVDAIREKATKNLSEQERLEARAGTRQGYVPARDPDGNLKQIPIDSIEMAQKRGWKIL